MAQSNNTILQYLYQYWIWQMKYEWVNVSEWGMNSNCQTSNNSLIVWKFEVRFIRRHPFNIHALLIQYSILSHEQWINKSTERVYMQIKRSRENRLSGLDLHSYYSVTSSWICRLPRQGFPSYGFIFVFNLCLA